MGLSQSVSPRGPSPEKKGPASSQARQLQSFDKGAIIQANSGLYASGAGPGLSSERGLLDRQSPACQSPSMIFPDARSLPHGLARLPKIGKGPGRLSLRALAPPLGPREFTLEGASLTNGLGGA
jgi:hypothetical protein